LWRRFLENPDSSVKKFDMAEDMMMKNPNYVFYASEALVKLKFINYPCRIYSSSNVLAKVKL